MLPCGAGGAGPNVEYARYRESIPVWEVWHVGNTPRSYRPASMAEKYAWSISLEFPGDSAVIVAAQAMQELETHTVRRDENDRAHHASLSAANDMPKHG